MWSRAQAQRCFLLWFGFSGFVLSSLAASLRSCDGIRGRQASDGPRHKSIREQEVLEHRGGSRSTTEAVTDAASCLLWRGRQLGLTVLLLCVCVCGLFPCSQLLFEQWRAGDVIPSQGSCQPGRELWPCTLLPPCGRVWLVQPLQLLVMCG